MSQQMGFVCIKHGMAVIGHDQCPCKGQSKHSISCLAVNHKGWL
jgi:hypothetical protein